MRGHYRGRRGYGGGYYRGRGGGAPGGYSSYPGMAQIKRDRARSEKTILVRGFPTETNVTDLTEFFEQYGTVDNIMLNMDKNKGMYAFVVFEEKESAQKVQAEPTLVMKEVELTIEEKKSRFDLMQETRKLNAEIVRNPTLTVFVKGIDKETPDSAIKEFFSQYGTVTGVLTRYDTRKEHFHYIQFEEKEQADAVIALDSIDFHGNTLTTDAKKTKEEMTRVREEEVNHSIYVQGFGEETTEDQIVSLFSPAGQVEKVHMDCGKMGAYAFVEFNSSEAVEAAVALENLSIGDKLLIVKKRELKEDRKKKWQAQIYSRPKQVIDHLSIVNKLLQLNTVEEQMKTLQSELELNTEDQQQRQEITGQLQQIFNDYFPGCGVEQFGSSINGFGIRGSDLDVFLDLKLEEVVKPDMEGYPKKAVPYIGDMSSLCVENGMITRESLQETDMIDRAKLIHRILTNFADHVFAGFLLIKNARCPIIRMIHTATDIRVDLSINNRLALNNTRLIRMYAEYDPRIKPLYYTVRHWAKYKDVAGNPMSGPKFTNYALSMMVFHYLTVCHPPVLPTVQQLASLADKKTIIDGWDCTLVTDKSKAPFPLNSESLIDLLAGFFHYFCNYDFAGQVMKSRSSQLVDKATFQAELDAAVFAKEVTEEDAGDKKKVPRVGSVCMLDPFVTNHNIAGNVNNNARYRIKYEFEQAATKMEHENFLKSIDSEGQATTKDWGLTFLFSRDRLRVTQLDDAGQLSEHGINLLHVAPYHLPISMKISQLPHNLLHPGPEREAFKDTWTSEILVFIQRVLSELMLVDCTDASSVLKQQLELGDTDDSAAPANGVKLQAGETSMEVESKRLKLEKMDPSTIILALKCSTRYRMWQNRKQLKKDTRVLNPDLDEFLLESQVTQKLLKMHQPNLDSVIEYYLTFSKEQTGGFSVLRMNMYPTIGLKEFTCFFAFLSAFIAKIVDKCFIIKS